MKLLIEIDTADQATLNEALTLVSLYKLKLEQPTTEATPAEEKPATKPKPETKPEPETVEETETAVEGSSEAVESETTEEVALTLTDLKRVAKEASGRTDRDTVVGCIKRYSTDGKLATVTENNYQALFNDLKAL